MVQAQLRIAGIVLCGGQSSRMGQPKHALQVGNATALERVISAVRSAVDFVIVVGSPDQDIPRLPGEARFVRDAAPHLGPLSGLLTGLEAVGQDADAVYLAGCDTPLLRSAFVRLITVALRAEDDAAAAFDGQFPQPLAAVYRTSIKDAAKTFFAQGERSLQALLKSLHVRLIPLADLRAVDPELDSLRGMNTAAEFEDLLHRATEPNEAL